MTPLENPVTYYKIIGGLGATLIIFFIALKGIKKLPAHLISGQGDLFQVIAKQSLDSKNTFYLIQSLGRFYLMLGTPQGLTRIDEFDAEEIEEYVPSLQSNPVQLGQLSEIFSKTQGKAVQKSDPDSAGAMLFSVPTDPKTDSSQ